MAALTTVYECPSCEFRTEEPSEMVNLWDEGYVVRGYMCHTCYQKDLDRQWEEYYRLKEEGFWDAETIAAVEGL